LSQDPRDTSTRSGWVPGVPGAYSYGAYPVIPSNLLPLMDGVASAGVNGDVSRSDHVHPSDTSRAPLLSPAFTGIPIAPTAAPGTSTTQLATTAFVSASFAAGVTSWNTRSGAVTLTLGDVTGVGGAPAASPTLTGTVTASGATTVTVPTPTAGDSSTKAASTAFVATSFAPLASPILTGTPALAAATAVTPTAGDNSTKVATTAFVASAIAATPVVQYSPTFRNRLINGNFSLDQRNEGAAVTASTYGPDKWRLQLASTGKLQVQRVALPVNGAGPIATRANYVLVLSSLGAYTPVTNDYFTCVQVIEADVIADLQFGASSAQPVVLSFWANLSGGAATGAYSISLRNNGGTRSYVTTFNMPAQGTWYYFQVPVPGDTAGTWVTSGNGGAMSVLFDGGCASPYLTSTLNAWQNGNFFASSTANKLVMTSSAALNIANVQLEVGTAATPFELLDPATALVRAQRYMEKSYPAGNAPGSTAGGNLGIVLQALGPLPSANYNPSMIAPFKVTKRAVPTVTAYSPTTGASGKARDFVAAADTTATPTLSGIAPSSFVLTVVANTAATSFNIGAHWTADADF